MSISVISSQGLISGSGTAYAFTLSGGAPSVGQYVLVSSVCWDSDATNHIASISLTGVTFGASPIYRVTSFSDRLIEEYWLGTVGAGASASGTVTANVAYPDSVLNMTIAVLSGVGIAYVPGSGSVKVDSSPNPTSNSYTPTAGASVMVLACWFDGDNALSAGPFGGFSALTTSTSYYAFAYRIEESASGSYSTGWTSGAANYASAGLILVETPPILFRPYLF